ncbi:DUF1499 domain-containing protein [Oceanicoccus sagamiensis]|uniref:DUF1499 domain-containing protein n=1 Tax=Oceanicoccus sagamiensis TaxID=716816 RepID=A0A1X9N480_9GAMM|nr:DUF1499 domain-containing protein [Oceanicoccus sagamiensis]ARN72960.1 hypothetical protein BST96_01865 [Oceanicoccus sagamiensis]
MTAETTAPASKGAQRIRTIAIVLLVLLPVSALGSRLGIWPYSIGLLLLSVSLLGSLIIQIINAIWLFRKPAAGTKSALRYASLIALPPLVLVANFMQGMGEDRPLIHNISTDLENPPQFVEAIQQRGNDSNPLEYSAEVATLQQQSFPEINSLQSDLSPEQAFAKALTTAEAMGWSVYDQNKLQGRIEAVDTTFWFGFKDDVVIRIKASDQGSIIDMRSVSRVGKGDMGANAKRIMAFQAMFKGEKG